MGLRQGTQRNWMFIITGVITVIVLTAGLIYRGVQYGPDALGIILPVFGIGGVLCGLVLLVMAQSGRRDVRLLVEHLDALSDGGVYFVFRKNKRTRDALDRLIPGSASRAEATNQYGAVTVTSSTITVWDGGQQPRVIASASPVTIAEVGERWLDEQASRLRAVALTVSISGPATEVPFGVVTLDNGKVRPLDDRSFASLCERLQAVNAGSV